MPHTPHCSEATEPRTGIEKREPFRFLTRSDIDIVTHVQCTAVSTSTDTDTRDNGADNDTDNDSDKESDTHTWLQVIQTTPQWYQPPPAGAPIIRVSCLDQQISFDNWAVSVSCVPKLETGLVLS